jgi:hypothetical protein
VLSFSGGNEIFQSDRETVERRVLEQSDKKNAMVKAKFSEWKEAKVQQIKAEEEKKVRYFFKPFKYCTVDYAAPSYHSHSTVLR